MIWLTGTSLLKVMDYFARAVYPEAPLCQSLKSIELRERENGGRLEETSLPP